MWPNQPPGARRPCDLLPWQLTGAARIVGCVNTSERLVVVGVDGTAASDALLRWAREFGIEIGARLRVVLAWQPPALATLVPFRVERALVDAAEHRLSELVAHNAKGVAAESTVVEGSPARVLLEAAKDADYLVIGRPEGTDPRPGMTIAARCAAFSPCPVIVVPVREAAS